MSAYSEAVTDAYVYLQVSSEQLTCEELRRIGEFEPTDVGIKGSPTSPKVPTSGKMPRNFISLSTEVLSASKSLDDHIAELRKRLPSGGLADRFDLSEVIIRAVVYWWTTEEIKFFLSPENLETLQNIGVPIEFNFLISDDEASLTS